MRTENWQRPTLGLVMGGKDESGPALSPYGPVKVGLTTTHRTQSQVLSELLSSLEREVESLNSKYCEAYVTLVSVMEHLVKLYAITKESDITEV